MNELEQIKQQLSEINNKRVRIQTLSDQAKQQCEVIEKKYNVSSPEELKLLVDKAQAEYEKTVLEAKQYIQETNTVLNSYNGII